MLAHLELKFKNVVRYLFGCHKISQDLAEKVPKYSCENEKRPHHLGLKKGVPKTFIETKNLA